MLLLFALILAAAHAPTAARELGDVARGGGARLASLLESPAVVAPPGPASFLTEKREVSNWRWETWRTLQPSPLSAMAVALDMGRPVVSRCVRLNNYWCIKSSGWNGELGADDEGHVGFESAERAADAAATLLRRYYLEFGRKTALDIVRRWAPAECRVAAVGGGAATAVVAVRGIGNTLRARWLAAHRGRRPGARVAAKPRMAAAAGPVGVAAPPPYPAQPRNPLVRTRGVVRTAPGRVSVLPLRPLPTFRVPDIAVGMGERPAKVASLAALAPPRRSAPRPPTLGVRPPALAEKPVPNGGRLIPGLNPEPSGPFLVEAPIPRSRPAAVAAAKPSSRPAAPVATVPLSPTPATPDALPRMVALAPALSAPLAPAKPLLACAPDEARIRNYATRIATSIGLKPGDDLGLFDADGRPLPRLASVMLAMSGFELGLLRASAELVSGAVERVAQRQRDEAARAAVPAP